MSNDVLQPMYGTPTRFERFRKSLEGKSRAYLIARAENCLTLRSSEKRVGDVLHAFGFMSCWDYPRDATFQRWVLRHLLTPEHVWAFLDQLDRENRSSIGSRACSKARSARSYFTGPRAEFWLQDIDRMRSVLSFSRRVCCGCHESTSFHHRIR